MIAGAVELVEAAGTLWPPIMSSSPDAAPHAVVALLAEHDVVAFLAPHPVALAAVGVAGVDGEEVARVEVAAARAC